MTPDLDGVPKRIEEVLRSRDDATKDETLTIGTLVLLEERAQTDLLRILAELLLLVVLRKR